MGLVPPYVEGGSSHVNGAPIVEGIVNGTEYFDVSVKTWVDSID
jgi:hypothetical protein